jgi:UDP-GlcNAc:undecaprenyl-phosphate GlcNAc-1-phosphate transferase
MIFYSAIFLGAALLTLLVTPIVRKLAHKFGALDSPSERKIHKVQIPRWGGLAIFIGFIIPFTIAFVATNILQLEVINHLPFLGIILSSMIILFVGVWDDVKPISYMAKFFWQFIAALIVLHFGVQIEFISNPFNGLFFVGFFSIPITLLWIVGITNAINLIDGLDGLACGVTAISAGTFFFVALQTGQPGAAMLILSLAGAALGFLFYNFYPAKIFLGDSGSLFLGFILATTSIIGVFKTPLVVALIIPLLILGVPIFDTLFAIGRRLKNMKSPFKADNKHIHHMLLRAGFSQREAVLSIYIACFLLSISALIMVLQK